MSYFSKFPQTIVTINGNSTIIQDVFRRISLSDEFRKNAVVLDDYLVLDGETPELVSNSFYGSPDYHWLVLMVNDIVDVRAEWPVPDANITDIVYDRYDFKVTVPDESEYSEDDVVESNTGGVFLVTGTDTNIVYLRSTVGKTIITTSSILENVTTDTSGLTVTSVDDPEEQAHHYYDTELKLIVDEGYSVTTIPVSNYEHEVAINDAKRAVKIVSPSFLSFFTSQFDDLIRG